jgi:hypothetical protein
MACGIDMDCSNNAFPRKAKKSLLKTGLMYTSKAHNIMTKYYYHDPYEL